MSSKHIPKVKHFVSGEPDVVRVNEPFQQICCYCNYTHLMIIKKHSAKELVVYAYVDDFLTDVLRSRDRKKAKNKK